jgi:hypothetical protein
MRVTHLDHGWLVGGGLVVIHKGSQLEFDWTVAWIDVETTIGVPIQIPVIGSIETFAGVKVVSYSTALWNK